jgi:hypothetical protein
LKQHGQDISQDCSDILQKRGKHRQ